MNIIIPSCKPLPELQELQFKIYNSATGDYELNVISGEGKSASQNRNSGLDKCNSGCVIMVDDDMTDFEPGWNQKLVSYLDKHEKLGIVSARLMNSDGSIAYMCSRNKNVQDELVIVGRVPTACIAFKNIGIRFDEGFIGSGFEDTDFCNQYRAGGFQCAITNTVKVVHLHEMKNQKGAYWSHNKQYYEKKWGKYT